MAGTTAKFALPYPTGTDRVMDGDNAMQALAEKIDAIIGNPRSATTTKTVSASGFKPAGMQVLPNSNVTLTMSAPGLCYIRTASDVGNITGTGYVDYRLTQDLTSSQVLFYDANVPRSELTSHSWLYMPAGPTALTVSFGVFAQNAAGLSIPTVRYTVYAIGGTPSLLAATGLPGPDQPNNEGNEE